MLQGSLTGIAGILLFIALILIVFLWWGRGWFLQWLKGSAGMLLLAGSVISVFMLVDLWSYRQLLDEEPLATVSIYELGDQQFDLTLVDASGKEQRFKLMGDQWQLDVRLLVWKGPVVALGAMPVYRLDRISGRYLSLEQERTSERTVYTLTDSRWFDLWSALKGHKLWLEAESGQAVYMPLVNGAVFSVHLTPKGMIARPLNDVAEEALGTGW